MEIIKGVPNCTFQVSAGYAIANGDCIVRIHEMEFSE